MVENKIKSIEYINAGAPFVVCDMDMNGCFHAIKAAYIDDRFHVMGQMEDTIPENFSAFLGKSPVLIGYGKSNRINSLIQGNNIVIYYDLYNAVADIFTQKKYDLTGIAGMLNVSDGVKMHGMGRALTIFRVFSILYTDYGLSIPTSVVRVKVSGAEYWKGPTKMLERIYLKTVPRTEIYYDVIKDNWVCKSRNVDIASAVRDALFMYDTDTTNIFVDKLRTKKYAY